MTHALSPAGRDMLARFVARKPLFTFDIDGTLAPIVARPDAARIPDALQDALRCLCEAAPVAVLTGRGRDDAKRMLAFTPQYVLGNHGVEGLPGWEERARAMAGVSTAWRDALAAATAPSLDEAGVLLEDKRYSLSLHYRHAPDHDHAERVIRSRVAALVPPAHVIPGKCVVNVLPPGAPTKGDSLRELLRTQVPSHCAVYAGDDDTDEHVFDLPEDLVLGVRVGMREGSGAALYVDDPAEMLLLTRVLTELSAG
jgi:trehalose 6-phosphate phosphatase